MFVPVYIIYFFLVYLWNLCCIYFHQLSVVYILVYCPFEKLLTSVDDNCAVTSLVSPVKESVTELGLICESLGVQFKSLCKLRTVQGSAGSLAIEDRTYVTELQSAALNVEHFYFRIITTA